MTERDRWWQGKRGEWYVVVQAALLALVFFGPRTFQGLPPWPAGASGATALIGAILLVAGALLFLAGAVSLGRNLTPLPHPKDNARLVVTGAYRLVRHPIYGGVILVVYGWSLLSRSWLTLVYATLVLVFLDVKSRREERWLVEKFPGYLDYRRKVRKLIPYLY